MSIHEIAVEQAMDLIGWEIFFQRRMENNRLDDAETSALTARITRVRQDIGNLIDTAEQEDTAFADFLAWRI